MDSGWAKNRLCRGLSLYQWFLINVLDMCRIYFPQGQEFGLIFGESCYPRWRSFMPDIKNQNLIYFLRAMGNQLTMPGFYLKIFGRVMINREGMAEYKKFAMTNY